MYQVQSKMKHLDSIQNSTLVKNHKIQKPEKDYSLKFLKKSSNSLTYLKTNADSKNYSLHLKKIKADLKKDQNMVVMQKSIVVSTQQSRVVLTQQSRVVSTQQSRMLSTQQSRMLSTNLVITMYNHK